MRCATTTHHEQHSRRDGDEEGRSAARGARDAARAAAFVGAHERTLFALAFGAASLVGISAFRSYLEGRRSVFHFELLVPLGATLLAIKIAEAVGARVTRVDRP